MTRSGAPPARRLDRRRLAGRPQSVMAQPSVFPTAAAPTEDSLDEAMERAWRRRHEWRSIGAAAPTSIRTLVPPDPAGALADMLLRVVSGEEPEAIEELGVATGEFPATP